MSKDLPSKVLSQKSKKLMQKNQKYTDEFKYKTVVLYSQVGSLKAIGLTLGIPYQTLKDWHATDWWKSVEDDIVSQKKAKLSGQIEKVREKAVNVVEDRLDNGDFFYDQKSGELIRRPVSADSASRILNSTLQTSVRLEELRQNEKRIETAEKTQDRLAKLKEEFARFAKATQIEGKAYHADKGTLGEDVVRGKGEVYTESQIVAAEESGESKEDEPGILS